MYDNRRREEAKIDEKETENEDKTETDEFFASYTFDANFIRS